MTVGEMIKQRRKELGIKQIDLAKKVGISKQNLYKYEKGIITNIPLDILKMIANVLEMSPAVLAGWETEIAPEIADSFITFNIIAESAAGYDRFAEYDDYSEGDIDIPLSWLKGRPSSDYFVIKVHGDSMYPMYQDVYEMLKADKATSWIFDNSKLRSVVPEFSPKITLEEGMRRTLDYLIKHEAFATDEQWNETCDRIIYG